MKQIPWRRMDWVNLSVIAAVHLLALAGVFWMIFHFSWWTLGLGLVWGAACGLSITGGYHRLFAHPTYRASWPLRLFYLLFGAASVQNSALKWASDHRRHHASTDQAADPYNIQKGFWWAHVGWVLVREDVAGFDNAQDLQADPLIRFQHRFYVLLALAMGFLLPMLLAEAWGDAVGGLLVAGFLRLFLQYHATFSVNSVAHCLGGQPYSRATSARDSFLTALITLGEGYHNFHHRFPTDYRNGVRFYHFDPTKWWVWCWARLKVIRDVRRTSPQAIAEAREAVRQAA